MQHCPHCGRPRRFPNVDIAETDAEVNELKKRYREALDQAKSRNADAIVAKFRQAVLKRAKAVICCSIEEVRRIASSDNELLLTFYQRGLLSLNKGSHVISGEKWDGIRPAAETALFGDETKREIHFAALALDDLGLTRFGNCSITLRTKMIAHRTSAIEENMLIFFKKRGQDYWRDERLPNGYRSNWENRGKLTIAKLADKLTDSTLRTDFARILLSLGPSSEVDNFIELHVFGGITVRTFEKVVLTEAAKESVVSAMGEDFEKWKVKWEIRLSTP